MGDILVTRRVACGDAKPQHGVLKLRTSQKVGIIHNTSGLSM